MPSRHNGGVIGKSNVPTLSVASGVWNTNAVHKARLSNTFPVPSADIVFGAISTTNTFGASSTAKTVSLALGGEASRIVIACTVNTGASGYSPTPTFNGTTMTLAHSHNYLGSYYAYIYYLLEASLPSAGTYTFSADPAGSPRGGLWCMYIYGAKQQAPEATAQGSGTSNNFSTNITTASNGAWVIDALLSADQSTGWTPSAGQTERADFLDSTSTSQFGSTKFVSSAGATSLGWSGTISRDYVHVLTSWAKL